MATVWIIHKGHVPAERYTPAEEYGPVRVVFDGFVSVKSHRAGVQRLHEALSQATEEDYLVATGFSLLLALAFHMMMTKFGVVRCLTWDRDHYTLVTLYAADLDMGGI